MSERRLLRGMLASRPVLVCCALAMTTPAFACAVAAPLRFVERGEFADLGGERDFIKGRRIATYKTHECSMGGACGFLWDFYIANSERGVPTPSGRVLLYFPKFCKFYVEEGTGKLDTRGQFVVAPLHSEGQLRARLDLPEQLAASIPILEVLSRDWATKYGDD